MNSELEAIMKRRRRKADGLKSPSQSPNPHQSSSRNRSLPSSNAVNSTSTNNEETKKKLGIPFLHTMAPPPPPPPPPRPPQLPPTYIVDNSAISASASLSPTTITTAPNPLKARLVQREQEPYAEAMMDNDNSTSGGAADNSNDENLVEDEDDNNYVNNYEETETIDNMASATTIEGNFELEETDELMIPMQLTPSFDLDEVPAEVSGPESEPEPDVDAHTELSDEPEPDHDPINNLFMTNPEPSNSFFDDDQHEEKYGASEQYVNENNNNDNGNNSSGEDGVIVQQKPDEEGQALKPPPYTYRFTEEEVVAAADGSISYISSDEDEEGAYYQSSHDQRRQYHTAAEQESKEEQTHDNSAGSNDDTSQSVLDDVAVEYEPPPAFDLTAFSSTMQFHEQEEQQLQVEQDMAPIKDFPVQPNPTLTWRSSTKFEQQHSAYTISSKPIINPITGNMIVCRRSKSNNNRNDYELCEIDLSNNCVMASTNILSSQFRQKVSTTHGAIVTGIASVEGIAVGTHRSMTTSSSHGGGSSTITRVRVAAILKMYQLSTTSGVKNSGEIEQQLHPIMAVWQWGYATTQGNSSISVQSLLHLPVTSNGECQYDPSTLAIADGICFLGGTYSKTSAPCIFMTKATTLGAATVATNNRSTNHSNVNSSSVSLSWSTAIVGPPKSSISTMSIVNHSSVYLAVALDVGSVAVWALETKGNKANSKNSMASSPTSSLSLKRIRRLDPATTPMGKPTKMHLNHARDEVSFDNATPPSQHGKAIHLDWASTGLPGGDRNSRAKKTSSLLMLAVTYSSNSMAIFNLSSMSTAFKTNSQLQEQPPDDVVEVKPFAYSWFTEEDAIDDNDENTEEPRTDKKSSLAGASWISLGPHCNPCLVLLFTTATTGNKAKSTLGSPESSRLLLGAIDLRGSYSVSNDGSDSNSGSRTRPLVILCNTKLSSFLPTTSDQEISLFGLLTFDSISSVVYYLNGNMIALSPYLFSSTSQSLTSSTPSSQSLATEEDDKLVSFLRRPVGSAPSGVDSAGSISWQDASSDDEGVLSIFTVTQCQEYSGDEHQWMPPIQRHWLCRTMAGDTKSRTKSTKTSATNNSNFGVNSTGGSSSTVVCELKWNRELDSREGNAFQPHRIVRCKNSGYAAILIGPALGSVESINFDGEGGLAINPTGVIMVDTHTSGESTTPIVGCYEGRDAVFLGKGNDGGARALVLSTDGTSIRLLTCPAKNSIEKGAQSWEQVGPALRPFLGALPENDYVECHRLFRVSAGSWSGLVLVGRRVRDGRTCICAGSLIDPIESQKEDGWSQMLPFIESDESAMWLKADEDVVSLTELPTFEDGRRCIAIATQLRVIIVSDSLQVVTETPARLSCSSLAWLGSQTIAFCTTDLKVRYLSCLEGEYSQGLLSTLPLSAHEVSSFMLLGVRPDRLIYSLANRGVRLVYNIEKKGAQNQFLLPNPATKPLLLLEPLLCNALCERDDQKQTNALLRIVVEKFGRKVASLAHSDDEGITNLGQGLTSKIYKVLSVYGFKYVASWLLTGTVGFERSSNCKILPSWVPMPSKAHAAINEDALLQIITNGDQYFSDYVKSPDQSMASTLPRTSDPSALFCRRFAKNALAEGNIAGALKLLDVAGSESTDRDIFYLIMSLQSDPFADITKVLASLSGTNDDGSNPRSVSCSGSTSCLAAVALDLKKRQVNGKVPVEEGECEAIQSSNRWVRQLAPSVQRAYRTQRSRHRLIGENAFNQALAGLSKPKELNVWSVPFNESKHFWNKGPSGEKENLLLLDRMEEWLGRHRPSTLGKEGAAAALERGEKTLADILSKANDYDDASFGEHSDDEDNVREGWIEGIGEGRTDEDNLSAYFRMSEGADDDSSWRTEGFRDLTRFQHKAVIIATQESDVSVQITTSGVDEGEPGKVKTLYDLVLNESGNSNALSGLVVEVKRGGSLDIGILHDAIHESRKKCSIEFWYHLPQHIPEELVIMKRSIKGPGDELASLCQAAERGGLLWELVVLPSGTLEFRCCGGSSMSSEGAGELQNETGRELLDFDNTSVVIPESEGKVSLQREDGTGGWNHVCLVFSSRGAEDPAECSVTLVMKGIQVASEVLSFIPPDLKDSDLTDMTRIDQAMDESALVFGASPAVTLRFTEIRVWSCERSISEIKSMMYEYLQVAETKRKFKVKIRNKRGENAQSLQEKRSGLLPPPVTGRRLPQPEQKKRSLLPPPRTSTKRGETTTNEISKPTSPLADQTSEFDSLFDEFSKLHFKSLRESNTKDTKASPEKQSRQGINSSVSSSHNIGDFSLSVDQEDRKEEKPTKTEEIRRETSAVPHKSEFSESFLPDQPSSEVFESVLLSKQVRTSAAAALVRGPPATRHFGGNRGGLAKSYSESNERFGVGAIAICGAEKTVVYKHGQNPPGKTYPIGASGAVISDAINGSEYLCCFLAKEKRMVVFELSEKTVVVELQMTTKLNFWRYMPPQGHGGSLIFTLITPVGGFHWMPLDESPRPVQVFKRGPDLQGKKIITYEEGGTNGLLGADVRSTVALLLASIASTGTPVEAWIMPLGRDSHALCISDDVLGAAFLRPIEAVDEQFLPLVVTAKQKGDSQVSLEILPLIEEASIGAIVIGEVLASISIDLSNADIADSPTLAMGTWPEVICCCIEHIVVVAIRRSGVVVAYRFDGNSLEMIEAYPTGHYIVDVALRLGKEGGTIEIVILKSDNNNLKDGRVVSITINL